MSKEVEGQLSLFDSVDDLIAELKEKTSAKTEEKSEVKDKKTVSEEPKKEKSEIKEPEIKEEPVEDIIINDAPQKKKTVVSLSEGISVENRFSHEKYTLIKDMGNFAYVRASDNTVHEMLKADMVSVD